MYLLSEAFPSDAFRASSLPTEIDSAGLLRGSVSPTAGLAFKWVSGSSQPSDVVWTDGFGILVSQSLRSMFSPMTGWSSTPVSLKDCFGTDYEGYHFLIVAGRCGAFQPFLSRRIEVENSNGRFAEYVGLHFSPGIASELDFQMPGANLNYVLLSRKARDVFQGGRFENVDIRDCKDVVLPELTYKAIVEKSFA
jgi:hypothetical protein